MQKLGKIIAQNVATHPGLFLVVGAKIQTIKDTRRSDKRESGLKPATNAHVRRILGLSFWVS